MTTVKRCASRASNVSRLTAIAFAIVSASMSSAQSAQTTTTPAKFNIQDAMSRINKGEVSPYDLNQIGRLRAKETTPALEKQFFASREELDKAQIAQVLVRLGDSNPTYWNYLEQRVSKVLDNPSPSPIATDSQGKELPGVSPAFEAWVDANKLDPPTALQNATIVDPAYVVLLGETGDMRAIPLLRRALSSSNYLIAASASGELAELKDEDSASLVADAASKAPPKAAALIAEPLGYLKSSEAQTAFTRYVPRDRANAVRERVQLGQSPVQ